MKKDTQETLLLIWAHRIVRWSFGGAFLLYGLSHHEEGSWFAIAFGAAILLTSFFRPKRCLEETCSLPTKTLTTNN